MASSWLPVATFFALALEHPVVSMFGIPTAMMLGADAPQWLLWNQLAVTLGNVVGGALLTGLLLHYCNASHPAPAKDAPGSLAGGGAPAALPLDAA